MPDLGKATYETRVDNRKFKSGMRETEREADRGLSRIRGHFQKTDKDIDKTNRTLGRFTTGMGKANIATTFFGRMIKLIKWPAMIVGAGLAAQAIGALTAGILALTSALAPLSGALVAYPGMLAAVVQGLVSVKLAFKGMSDVMKAKTLEDLEEATKGWSKETREAALTIRGLLKPAMEDLNEVAREQVLPKAAKALRRIIGSQFPVIRKIIKQTTGDFGDFLLQASKAFSTARWSKDLKTIGGTNRVILNQLGDAVIYFSEALRNILVAAGPFLKWMSRGISGFAEWASNATMAGRKSGALTDFFEETKKSMQAWWEFLKPLGTGLLNLIKLGKPLGDTILKDLTGAAETFQEWTESASGQNTIKKWFEDAKGPIYEIAYLVRDITGIFLRLGTNKGVSDLFKKIRTDLLPVVEELIASTTEVFGPHLINALIEVAELFGGLAGESGPLIVMVDTIGALASGLNAIFDEAPGVESMTINLIGMAAVFGLVKAVLPIKSFQTMISLMTPLVKLFGKTRLGILLITAAQWLWNASLYGFPLVWIIAALVAVGVGLFILYKKSETFRKIVHGAMTVVGKVFDWMKDHWEIFLFAFTGGLGLAVAKVIQHRKQIIGFFRSMWGKIKDIFGSIKNGIVGAWDWVKNRTADIWYDIYSTVAGWINKVIKIINKIPGVEIGTIGIDPNSPADIRSAANIPNRADGGMIGPRPGGVYRVAEAGKPEMVIPLDPAKRGRALGLVAETLGRMGVGPQSATRRSHFGVADYGLGGLVDLPGKVIGGVGSAVKGGWDLIMQGAGAIINMLPGIPNMAGDAGRIVGGVLGHARGKIADWIRDKVGSLNPFSGGGGGTGGGGGIIGVGRMLQRMGYLVGEHPAFGGVGRHTPGSYHYSGRAIDVNWPGGGPAEMAMLDRIYPLLSRMPHAELIWRAPDHWDHLHYAMAKGGSGVVRKPTSFLAGENGPEAFAFRPLGGAGAAAGGGTIPMEMDLYITNWETGRGVIRAEGDARVDARDDFSARRGRTRRAD